MNQNDKHSICLGVLFGFMIGALVSCRTTESAVSEAGGPVVKAGDQNDVHQAYLDFFEEVFKTMETNYYQPVSRDVFNKFIEKFNTKIYSQLKGEKKSDDYVRWRSAAFLIDDLKSSEDIFSAFYPPEPAQEYKQSALGVRMDLGIEGKKVDNGFQVTHVEPRADAYGKGLRDQDLLVEVQQQDLKSLKESEITDLLNPLADTVTHIKFLSAANREEKEIDVETKEFFRQTVFMVPTPVPEIYGLRIQHFNRMTGEDMFRFLRYFRQRGDIKGLVLDLRGNPGGPPLAAREILSFFLPPMEEFAYFQRRGEARSSLDVPGLPGNFHYEGPLVVLIDKGSGSSSELFSGALQKRGRAILMGRNSAGQVMLKSMFNFDDGSMVLLVTARGHHPDGSVFPFTGLRPDRFVKENDDDAIMKYAVSYLLYANRKDAKKITRP